MVTQVLVSGLSYKESEIQRGAVGYGGTLVK
jgi:hypothetical protein